MAKRFTNEQNDRKFKRTITRNWIIMGVSGALIVILMIISANAAH